MKTNELRIVEVSGFLTELARKHEEEVSKDAVPFMVDVLMGVQLFWNMCTGQEQQLLPFTHTLNHLAVQHMMEKQNDCFDLFDNEE